jgi:hypothetical protein
VVQQHLDQCGEDKAGKVGRGGHLRLGLRLQIRFAVVDDWVTEVDRAVALAQRDHVVRMDACDAAMFERPCALPG